MHVVLCSLASAHPWGQISVVLLCHPSDTSPKIKGASDRSQLSKYRHFVLV